MVLWVAIICLLILDKQTVSLSIKSNLPTPLLASASTTKPPTPPTPNTATCASFNFSIASLPNNNSVLINFLRLFMIVLV